MQQNDLGMWVWGGGPVHICTTYHYQVAGFHVAPHQDRGHVLLVLENFAHIVAVVLQKKKEEGNNIKFN